MTALNLIRAPNWARPFVTQRTHSLPETDALLEHHETLLQEAHHRVGNSLQLIASMLAQDAREVTSSEAQLALVKAHRRILAVATVQHQLEAASESGDLEFADYLRRLCESLTASVICDATRIRIDVRADAGKVSSAAATKLGLIVTELVINAVKHAFTSDTDSGVIVVTYRVERDGWTLAVSDNGAGKPKTSRNPAAAGAGAGIVAQLVRQLGGRTETAAGPSGSGTMVSITGRPKKARIRIGA